MNKSYPVRYEEPKRTCTKVYSHYRTYKKHLAADFLNRCGYCGDFDGWIGGISAYHIDHFAPKKKFELLMNNYDNLVYACPYCNRFKSDEWPSESHEINVVENVGFIDPCDGVYEEHLYRNPNGSIVPSTELGEYIYNKLQLSLTRHKVLWNLSKLSKLKFQLKEKIEKANLPTDKKKRVEASYLELSLEADKYMEYLLGDKF